MKLIILFFLYACSLSSIHVPEGMRSGLVVDHRPSKDKLSLDRVHPTLKSQWVGTHWQLQGAPELLQDTEAASVSIRFKAHSIPTEPQDLIALSVGATAATFSSRFSIRIENGQFKSILRAADLDQAQEWITTGAALRPDQWHTVTLVVSYAQNRASFYLDGHKLEGLGTLKFTQAKTASTGSASMAIGSEDDGSTFFFLGEISQVLIWRRELSREEVYQL